MPFLRGATAAMAMAGGVRIDAGHIAPWRRNVQGMIHYRFLDGMGEAVAEGEFDDHAAAIAWAQDETATDADIHRVEYLGAGGDWRWAGALGG